MLAAILAYAATALTLLVVGQFVSLPPVARDARHGHRPDRHGARRADDRRPPARQRAPGRHRRPDRPRQPPPSAVTARRRDRGQRRRGRAAADRPRRLQGAQRHARPLAPATRCCARSARAWRRRCGPGDTLARLGGDEFAVVLDPGDEAIAPAPPGCGCARRSSARSASAASACTSTPASASRSSPSTRDDALGLLQRADVAMYEAKRTRTGHEVYLPARDHHSAAGSSCWASCATGWPTASSILHYQPKAEIATGDGPRRRGARALGAPAPRAADADRLPAAGRPQRARPLADRVRARPRAGGDRRAPARRLRPLGRRQPRPRRPARPRAAERGRARAREARLPARPACGSR